MGGMIETGEAITCKRCHQILKTDVKHPPLDALGLITCRKAQQTGYYVSLYDGEKNDMDTFSGRWQTVCEQHGSIISHRTKRIALSHLAYPLEWCEYCMEEQS